jgi:Cof subfamily protein (haloacid dehalogenase superfamily)
MYKLLAMDLDGTLMNDDHEIPENNKRAIAAAVENGVSVCLCSGRSYMSLHRFEQQLSLDVEPNYGICFNGSIVYKTWNHETLLDTRIDNGTALFIAETLKKFGGDIIIYMKDRLFAEKETPAINAYTALSRVDATFVDSFGKITQDVSKVLIKSDPETLKHAAEYMKPIVDGKCNQFLTEASLLEYTAPNATKGAALTFLAGYIGVDMDDVIAVGDHHNDVHMIKEAGVGVAVANAVGAAKEAADYITKADNNAGAIYEIVKKFLVSGL